MTENQMFCFQCQETAKGTGCTVQGVCGKKAETNLWQDLLLSIVRGVGTIAHEIGKVDNTIYNKVEKFIPDALFSTITNANFDDAAILQRVDTGLWLKADLLKKAEELHIQLPKWNEVTWGGEKAEYAEEGKREGVLRTENEDIRSLKELTVLGLKGMAAYYEHAAHLGKHQIEIIAFMCKASHLVTNPDASADELLACVMETGKFGVDAMALLDAANTGAYGNPELTKVNIGVGKNPGILISGHDLSNCLSKQKVREWMFIPTAKCCPHTIIHSSKNTNTSWVTMATHGGSKKKSSKPSTVPSCLPPTVLCLPHRKPLIKIACLPPTRRVSQAGSIFRPMLTDAKISLKSLPWPNNARHQQPSNKAKSWVVLPMHRCLR